MALKFYRQRDIDEMDVSNIPEDFKSYFDTLSEERKKEINETRPDLCEKLGFINIIHENEKRDSIDTPTDEESSNTYDNSKKISVENIQLKNKKEDIFKDIKDNYYKDKEIHEVFVNNMEYLEILTVPDDTDKCIVHECDLENIQVKFSSDKEGLFSMILKVCPKCKRAYLEEKKIEYNDKKLSERHIKHKIYNLDLTMKYLYSIKPAYNFKESEILYIAETWVDENPVCPVHDCKLNKIKCVKKYKDRKLSFDAYYCEQCSKVILRNGYIPNLMDELAQKGIPIIKTEVLEKKKPEKQVVPKKEIRPDYFVEDGVKSEYTYKYNTDCYNLDDNDTIVVSDSIYCNIEGHERATEEVLVLVKVDQKRGGIKSYLLRAGYCSICQKYYIEDQDYKILYGKGRPIVTVITDLLEDSYKITSGEVFDLEKTHLNKLEDQIASKVYSIKHSKGYVSKYQVNELHYDDGGLNFAKNMSIGKYDKSLEELYGYKNVPYTYRVDLKSDDKNLTFYVGAEHIYLDKDTEVISYHAPLGHELVNYKTTKVTIAGREYGVKLTRQFEIENAKLYNYANIKTDDDLIFKAGVTDPFLVRVLNFRKKQHNLVDIIATIQENQNRIVEAPYHKNIIVQGCAGSGKTMVLLHRLSSLKYHYKEIDFEQKSLILTPNDNLSLQIKSVAEGLQIGKIERKSVEDYYIDMLVQYSKDFNPENKPVSEMNVDQSYVNYIYSDEFKNNFDKAFDRVIEERNEKLSIINDLIKFMGYQGAKIDFTDSAIVVDRIKMYARRAEEDVKAQASKIKQIEKNIGNNLKKKNEAIAALEKAEEEAENIVRERIPGMYSIIGTYVSERDNKINDLKQDIEDLQEKYNRLEGSFFVIRKKAQLQKLENEIKTLKNEYEIGNDKITKENKLLDYNLYEATENEIFSWMYDVSQLIPKMTTEIKSCKDKKEEILKCKDNVNLYTKMHVDSQKEYADAIEAKYPEEAQIFIKELNNLLDKYSLLNTFNIVFDAAVKQFKDTANREIKIIGKYHRYDLYAELLFAMKYFNKVQGDKEFICVDEGQDLSVNEYSLISELNGKDIIYNIYGDTNQLMKKGRGINDWQVLIDSLSADKYVLNENYRNTNQITRFCNSSFDMDVKRTGVDGVKVREISKEYLEEEINNIHVGNDKVAILISRSYRKNNLLHKDLLNDASIVDPNKIDSGVISLLYVDEAKGVEFQKVYVVVNKMDKNEKYIAYTRALSELIVVVDENVE